MADLSKIKLNGTEYDLKDSVARNNLPLIITGSCNFTSSLTSGIDTPLEVTNVSKTYANIAEAVSNNKPVKMIVSNGNLKVSLDLTAFDGNIYYFTNSYDPFTGMVNGVDNESFNITVRAEQVNNTDVFTWIITYNKNAFATKSEVTTQISTAVGNLTEFDTQVVQSLPATGVKGTIYSTPNNHGTNDIYDEFIYVNNAWEKIGNTQVDLSNYVQEGDLANVAITGSYNNLVDRPNIPTSTNDLVNNSGFITLSDIPEELPTVTSNDNGKVLTVVNGDWDKANVPTELPNVTSSDNGKILTVSSGTWAKGDLPETLPAVTSSDNGKILTVSSGTWAKGDVPTELPAVTSSDNDKVLAVVNGIWTSKALTIPQATTVTQTLSSGIKIAEINGVSIYAPSYSNGDNIAY